MLWYSINVHAVRVFRRRYFVISLFLNKKNVIRKWASQNLKKMWRKSPASNAWAAIFKVVLHPRKSMQFYFFTSKSKVMPVFVFWLWSPLWQTIKIGANFLCHLSLHRNKRLLTSAQAEKFFVDLLENWHKWKKIIA